MTTTDFPAQKDTMRPLLYAALLSLLFIFVAACEQPSRQNNQEASMPVTVVSRKGCSATQPTLDLITTVAKELGITIQLDHLVVTTQQQATENRHIGSPTVRINGRDIDPAARDIEQFGLG